MAQLCAGQDGAFNSLMDRHGERLFHYLLRQLGSQADAADLAQETFVRVYRHRQRFRRSRKFTTWLYAIATNLLRDRFRWQRRHPQVSLDAPAGAGLEAAAGSSASPSEELAGEERAREVRQAIRALPEDLRSAVILSTYEGMSHAEVGAVLDCSAKAVETRLYRARALLRKRLEG
jgi:RNA polymerase sigma-70 factor (ECF subfamily)